MYRSYLFLLVAMAGLCNCASRPQKAPKSSLPAAGIRRWEGRTFDRVVGFRFLGLQFVGLPGARNVVRADSKPLDMAGLRLAKRQEAVLSESETDQLMDAILGDHPVVDRAMCYEPHHIFIFFSKDRPIGAFEICFQCQQSTAWPRRDLHVTESYAKLATLCKKLGLSIKPPSR